MEESSQAKSGMEHWGPAAAMLHLQVRIRTRKAIESARKERQEDRQTGPQQDIKSQGQTTCATGFRVEGAGRTATSLLPAEMLASATAAASLPPAEPPMSTATNAPTACSQGCLHQTGRWKHN